MLSKPAPNSMFEWPSERDGHEVESFERKLAVSCRDV